MNMSFSAHWTGRTLVAAFAMVLLSSCIHKKYENPITKDTQQPDKKLFDKAMVDIEKGRYEVARLTLNTLMNTYESSEYLAKAKLAIADSWFREAGPNGMAQAEAEYKDFELFYPTMPEASEAQHKICMIHYKQMEKADRDPTQALRAEDECRQLLVQYPNSKYAPETSQLLRNIDEVLGSHEFGVGHFYFDKGANPAAANRLGYAADQYPLYSKADQALYETGIRQRPPLRASFATTRSAISPRTRRSSCRTWKCRFRNRTAQLMTGRNTTPKTISARRFYPNLLGLYGMVPMSAARQSPVSRP
jgi:outer membrane protein assembly factor BamD